MKFQTIWFMIHSIFTSLFISAFCFPGRSLEASVMAAVILICHAFVWLLLETYDQIHLDLEHPVYIITLETSSLLTALLGAIRSIILMGDGILGAVMTGFSIYVAVIVTYLLCAYYDREDFTA